jgi:hypothetical protein
MPANFHSRRNEMNNENQEKNSNAASTSAPAGADRQEGVTQDTLRDEKQLFISEPTRSEGATKPSSRKSTGPRTLQGKKRSRFNALKYGFYSKSVVWERESREQYDALLTELRKDCQPQGILENIEVEYLAALYWQRRRNFEIERGESSKQKFFVEDSLLALAIQRLNFGQNGELKDEKSGESSNLRILRNAINGLTSMRLLLKTEEGPQKEKQLRFFRKLLGVNNESALNESVSRIYLEVLRLIDAQTAADDEAKDGKESNFLACEAIDVEIKRLVELHNDTLKTEKKKIESEGSALSLLPQKVLDPLLRCQSHVTREIEKTLARLERLQRIRTGQQLPPQLDVKIS